MAHGLFERLIDWMERHGQHADTAAAVALAVVELSSLCLSNRQRLRGCLPRAAHALTHLLRTHERRADVMEAACCAVGNMAHDHPAACQQFVTAGACAAIRVCARTHADNERLCRVANDVAYLLEYSTHP